jgi:hypothetical protein
MPLLIPIFVGLAGVGVGFWAGDGTKSINDTLRWAVIGGIAFVAAKHFKVI